MPIHVNQRGLREALTAARRHPSPRRTLSLAGIGTAYAFVYQMQKVTQQLDEWLHPELHEQPVRRPVFIMGNPRSGTTMMHRLLSKDADRFASFLLYQSMFSSVTVQKAFQAIGRFDQRHLGGRLTDAVVGTMNKLFFSGWEGIHEMGIDKAEEDEATFALCFQTPAINLFVPYPDELPSLNFFDLQPKEDRARFMQHYREVVQRHLYASGPDKQFLNKNVFFGARIRSMIEEFPDAVFIYMIRHPYEALPSFLNMWRDKWQVHSPEITDESPQAKALVKLAYDYYRYALACRRHVSKSQFLVVPYDDLVADPRGTVERVYAKVGFDVSPEFRKELDDATSRQRFYESTHEYSLEQFGLTKREVYEALKDVFDEFGFDPQLDLEQPTIEAPARAASAAA